MTYDYEALTGCLSISKPNQVEYYGTDGVDFNYDIVKKTDGDGNTYYEFKTYRFKDKMMFDLWYGEEQMTALVDMILS